MIPNQVLMIGGVVVLALLGIRFGPAIKEKLSGTKAASLADGIGSSLDGIGDRLVVVKEDFEATVQFVYLRRLHHYVDGLPDADKAKGHEAIGTLMQLIGLPPGEAPVVKEQQAMTDRAVVIAGK